MQRLTKAAIATGAAAVLLVGGAGTMAYWTGSATDTSIADLNSGSFTLSAGTCGPWAYANNPTQGPPNVTNGIVPGDTVTTACTYTLTFSGDHVALGGATVDTSAGWLAANNLTSALQIGQVTSLSIAGGGTATITNGLISPPLPLTSPITSPVVITANVTVNFPYGNAESTTTSTQSLTATLAGISVTLQQGNDAYNLPAPASVGG